MSFILLGFAVLMPLGVSVRITFSRREKALASISSLQTHAHSIYVCHAVWDWGKAPGSRSKDQNRWLNHSDECLRTLIAIGDELTRFLTLPNSSYSRHRETWPGRREAAVTVTASYRLFGDVIERKITKLALLCESLKLAGFSPSEASRVRQYEKLLTSACLDLRMLKMYRSPKALNALLNLTTTLLPPFYAPAFAQIAHDTGSLAIALAFATITALALSALYESVQVLEDPFVAFLTLDGIDVYEELAVLYYHQLVETRRYIFPDAPEFIESDGEDGSNDAKEDDGPPATLIGRRSMLSNNKHGMVSSRKMVEGAPQIDRCSSLKNMDRSSVFEMSVPPTDRRASLRTMNRKSVFSMDLPDSRRRPSRILQNREKPDLRRQSVHNN
eukprot:CAMPEP_0183301102 /NCGR_PEP_ID=MMETSP0160_2-20130417/7306_1 /TAXON_ID=2839 ORGANISM="Odontella Sinensis, Strain Grunow 1884" /NCGR_SAMPLE_ID=MMETSP0160_2 /ASSEMBLY_ACC=CAM_ASM_000250 /LENGTH=386 /DNA_ID=CAMNT_0025463635 /DNA_START=164 /DNA_END=1324 /DNA_ORIENTATION=+